MSYLSEFNSDNVYQEQTDVGLAFSIIRDSINGYFYYMKNDGYPYRFDPTTNTELKADTIVGNNYDSTTIALNRDGDILVACSSFDNKISTFNTSDMTHIQTSSYPGSNFTKSSVIDKNGYLWVLNSAGIESIIRIANLGHGAHYASNTSGADPYSLCVNRLNECFFLFGQTVLRQFKVNPNLSLGDGLGGTSPITISLTTPLVGAFSVQVGLNDAHVLVVEHLTANSSRIRMINTTTGNDIYTTGSIAGLYYAIDFDSSGKIYACRYDASVKATYVWDADLTNKTTLQGSIGSNEFNIDPTGYVHSEITGAEI